MKLLHIDSSILGDHSVSRTLTAEIVKAEARRHPDAEVVYRDLAAQPLGHLSGAHLAAAQASANGDAASVSAELEADLVAGQAALDDFLSADVLVIGAPMYNFSLPTQLKAWIDRISVAGKTFRYTAAGPEGLARGKRGIIASSRGGVHSEGSPSAFLDHQETYLRAALGFLGVEDVRFVRAEGVNIGPEQRQAAIEAAMRSIESGERLAA